MSWKVVLRSVCGDAPPPSSRSSDGCIPQSPVSKKINKKYERSNERAEITIMCCRVFCGLGDEQHAVLLVDHLPCDPQ